MRQVKKAPGIIRVAAYCRVSTDKVEQQESLENQMKLFREMIEQHEGWRLVGIYADKGLTGTIAKKRPEFMRLIRDCKAGRVDFVITKSISRFARNTLDCLQYVRDLQKLGVNVLFQKEDIDTSNTFSEMILTVMAAFAQEESRSLSENTKWGIRKRYEKGEATALPLYGYRHEKEEKYIIVPEEAIIVQEIFLRFTHGEAARKIAENLNEREISAPRSGRWTELTIRRMLRNEKYAGDLFLQKGYVEDHLTHKYRKNDGIALPTFFFEDHHDAIVSRKQFRQAVDIFQMRCFKKGICTYPYGERLRCPHCWNPLVRRNFSGISIASERCKAAWGCFGSGGCGQYMVLEPYLDAAVLRTHRELEAKYDAEEVPGVEYYWLDEEVEHIALGQDDSVTIVWKNGHSTEAEMNFRDERQKPAAVAELYRELLERMDQGKVKKRGKYSV